MEVGWRQETSEREAGGRDAGKGAAGDRMEAGDRREV